MVLLAVDCQKALVTDQLFRSRIFIQNVKDMIAAARKNHVEVIYVIHDDGEGQELSHGMPGFEIYGEFRPENGEKVFEKHFNSAFRNTGLDAYLMEKHETEVIVIGLQSDMCINATVIAGFEKGFHMVVPSFCNSTFDNRMMDAETSYRYFNEFLWPGRFAECACINPYNRMADKSRKSLLESTNNTRELRGYSEISSQYTKQMSLLRSDAPDGITGSEAGNRDLSFLKRYGITTVIDMRLTEDVAEKPGFSACADQLDYHNIPIREGDSIPESTEDVPYSYMRIAKAQNMPQVFHTIAKAKEGVLFNCSAGKDRSGTVAAILLLLAGVGRNDIVSDYMLTKENNKERFEMLHRKYPELKMKIVIPQEEYMNKFIDLFLKEYRNAENYMLQIGLSDNEVMKIKKKQIPC